MIDLQKIKNDVTLLNLVNSMLQSYKNKLQDADAIASGKILKMDFDIKLQHKSYEVVFNLQPEWKYIEYGRRPGKQPPSKVIEDWIRIKPVAIRNNKKVPNIKALAFVIAHSIGQKGVRGKHLLENTLNESENIIQKIKNRLKELIEDQVANEINNDNIWN